MRYKPAAYRTADRCRHKPASHLQLTDPSGNVFGLNGPCPGSAVLSA